MSIRPRIFIGCSLLAAAVALALVATLARVDDKRARQPTGEAGPLTVAEARRLGIALPFAAATPPARAVGSSAPSEQIIAAATAPSSDVRVTNPAALVPGPEKNMYEPVIAINPLNPDNLIAFATDLSILNRNTNTYAADRAYRSVDGGRSWTDLGYVRHPRQADAAILGADPVTVFDRDGSAYFAHLFRPANEWRSISVYRSTDGGATWSAAVDAVKPERNDITDRCTSYDKEWLSLGRNTGELLLVYTSTTFSCKAGDLDPGGVLPLATITDMGIYMKRSTDFGQTWSAAEKVWNGYALGAIARVAPDGSLVVAMWAPVTTAPAPCPAGFGPVLQPSEGKPVSAIVVATSNNDGATWSYHQQSQCSYDLLDDSGLKPGRFGGGNRFPAIWADPTVNGVFVAYPTINPTQNRFTIQFISSKDGGSTWSPPIEVTPGPDDARMPALVARDGVLWLAYVVSRADDSGDTMLRRSTDGGATWSKPIKLSSAPAQFNRDPNRYEEVRDYIGMDIVGNRLAVAWTDQRNGAPTEIWSRVLDIARPASLLNISTRVAVGTGDQVAIGGFIVRGAAAKQVVIRALGPSLNINGTPVPGRLEDPVLELRDHTGALIARNDNWRSTQQKQIAQSGLAPADAREAAMVRRLEPGSYTAIIRGAGGTSGVGLVEVYDVERTSGSELANISTRGSVGPGDNALIGGFILAPGERQKILLRALGPTLAGVSGALQDPTLTLHDSDGTVVAANDDWKDEQRAKIEATGIAPRDDRESAIVRTLSPGTHTAIVRGSDGTTGVALVEVYDLAR